jgi:hypothetical protein
VDQATSKLLGGSHLFRQYEKIKQLKEKICRDKARIQRPQSASAAENGNCGEEGGEEKE